MFAKSLVRSKFSLFLLLGLLLFLLVGASAASAESAAPWIQSDQLDYSSGSIVTLTSGGWLPGESVQVTVSDSLGLIWDYVNTDVADQDGNFTDIFQLPTNFVAQYTATATGETSGTATTSFTDSTLTVNPTSGLAGSTTTVDGQGFGNKKTVEVKWDGSVVVGTFTSTAGGGFTGLITIPSTAGAGIHSVDAATVGGGGGSASAAFTVTSSVQTTLLAVSSASGTYGGTVDLSATLSSGGVGVSGKTVSFTLNGGSVVTAITNSLGVASLTGVSLSGINAAVYSPGVSSGVAASFAGDSSYSASSGSATLTVNPKTLTITADDQSKTYGDAVTFLGTEFSTAGLVNSDSVTSVTLTSAGAAGTATVAGSPYAIVASAASGTGLGNYTITYVDGALTVGAKTLTITADDQSKTYGDLVTFLGTEFTTAGLVGSDTVTSVTLTSAGAAAGATVAGSPYAIVPSAAVGTGLGNYTIGYVDGALTVNPKTLTITADDQSKTYGVAVTFLGTEFTTAGLVGSDTVTSVTLTSAGAAAGATVAGSPYAIVASAASGTGLGNYTIGYVDGALTVNPKTLTITADDQSKTYGVAVTFLGTEFTTAGLVGSDTVTSVTLTSAGAAGTATVAGSPYAIVASAASGTGLGNYTIGYVDGALTVNPKTLTITADDQSKTYGDLFTFAGTEFTTAGLVGSDSVTSVTLTSAGAAGTATVAGSPYAIVPSAAVGTGLGNYTIGYVDGALTVNPKTLTITADDQSKTYGDTLTLGTTAFTTAGLVGSDTVTSVTLTSAGAAAGATVAGSPYAIVASAASGTGLGNYTIGYVDGALTVNPKTLTITADDQSKTYGDLFTFAGTEFTTAGLVGSDTVTSVTLTSAGAAAGATVAGSPYAIVASAASGTGLGNYTIGYVDGALTVNPKTLTITADDQSKTYGDLFTFAGTEFTTAGLINGDTVTSVSLGSAGAAATAIVAGSPYDILINGATGTGLDNYDIHYANGALTVNPKTLTITADDQSKTYGDTLTLGTTAFTTAGLVGSDTVTSVTLTSAGAAAGATVAGSPYAIVASAASGSGLGNYTIGYVDGALTVNPKTLTITADDQSKTYGDTLTLGTTAFTTAGLVGSDTVTSVTLTSAGAAAGATVAGSPYAIVASAASGTGLGNYTIGYVDGALTVNPKTLTITADDQSKTYGDLFTFAGTEFTTAGLINGDTVTSVSLGSAGAAATAIVAGSPYDILINGATGTGLDNYDIHYANGALTVNPKTLTITADDQSKTYGDTLTLGTTAFTTAGLVGSDTVTSVTLTSAGAAAGATVAGSPYAIVASAASGSGLGNYTIGYVDGALTVNPKTLTITADDQSKTYGDTLTLGTTAFTTAGLVGSDTVTSVTLTSAGAAAGATVAGSPYAIVASAASGSGLGNYTIGYVDGALTVNPKTLTITADNRIKTYGDTLTLGTTAFTTAGLVGSDTVTSVTLTSAGAADTATVAGSPYAIVASAASGTGLGNYTITYANGALTVGAKTLTITADNRSKTYGVAVAFLGTEFTTTGLVGSDTVTSVTLTSAGAAGTATVAGSPYAIVASAASGTGLGNYTIGYVDGALTVNPKTLTITADDQSKTYGDTLTLGTTAFTTAGLVGSDTVTSVTLTSAGAAAGATVAGSPYAIVASAASGTGLGNYTIGYVDGALTVNPKTLTITADDQSKTYGDLFTFAGTEFTTAGLINGDTVTSVSLGSAGAAATAIVAGSPYDILINGATGTGLGNYTIGYVKGNLTVERRTVTGSFTAGDKVYDGNDIAGITGRSITGGVVGSDVVTLTGGSASFADTNVGTWTVTGTGFALGGANAGNYVLGTVATTTAKITPEALSITATNQTKTFGDLFTFAGTEFTHSALVTGDSVTSVTLTSAGAAAGATVAGSPYAIVPSGAIGVGLGNYAITYHNGTLTVTKAETAVDLTVSPAQYSDFSTFTATVSPTLLGGSALTGKVQFSVDGSPVGSAVVIDSSGVAKLKYKVLRSAGTYSNLVTAAFTSTNPNFQDGASAPKDLVVTKENASIAYTGDSLGVINVNLNLQATVMDSAAVGYLGTNPETGSDKTIGDITKLSVYFDVYTVADTPVLIATVGPVNVLDTGVVGDGIGTAQAVWSATEENSYQVIARLDTNDWYVAPIAVTAPITFYEDFGQFITGGGWVVDPATGSHGNFGFNARFTKKRAHGQFIYVWRGSYNGTPADFIIKSNALSALSFTGSDFPLSATLSGKASLQINRASDGVSLYGKGGLDFTASVYDSGISSGRGVDWLTLTVMDGSSLYKSFSKVFLSGGNIVIHLK